MIESQPNTEEIFKVLSEAKEYHREVIINLVQAKAPIRCLSSVLEVLAILDVAAIASSPPNLTSPENAKAMEERLYLIEEHIGIPRRKSASYLEEPLYR